MSGGIFPLNGFTDDGGGVSPFTNMTDFKVISVDTSSSPQSVVIASADIAIDYIFFLIKDESNNAATNNISVATEGGELFDGSPTIPDVTADSGGIMAYSHNGNLFNWGS